MADPDGTVAARLDVHGWPTALILRSDGMQIARIGGATESFSLKLAPYLAAADSDRSAAEADQQRFRTSLITDGPSTIPARNLQLARQLIDTGKPAPALDLLIEAAKIAPKSIPVQLAMIQTLADLKRAGDAMALLGRIEPAALPAGQHDLLRARVLIAMNRSNDAVTLLNELLRAHPELNEAHYLLGMIHEQNGDWKAAAAEYRAGAAQSGK
jgi:predicted Zn-dependent protease